MKAVIMAGGEGARLRPLTCDLPKPMVPLLGRPIMEYIVELLVKHGIKDMAVTLQYLPEKIREHFGNGKDFGAGFSYFLEEEPMGTAGSVKNAVSFLDQTFLVISGDCLTDFDLTRAVEFHQERKAMATIVLTRQENPLEYGIIIADEKGRITRFLEKPRWGDVFSDMVNTGIYILEPEVLDYIPSETNFDFSKNLFPLLLEKKIPLFGCLLDGFWCDIGSHCQYIEAQRNILAGKVNLKISADLVEGGIWIGPGAQLDPACRLVPPAFIGEGSRIFAEAVIGEFSVIGRNNIIGWGSKVIRGITWDGVVLGEKASLKGGVLCRKVSLGPRASVYEEAVIGDRSVIEERAVIKPQVKVWPHKRVESGAVLWENLIWGNRACRFLFGSDGIKGELNGELSPEMVVRICSAFGFSLGREAKVVLGSEPDNSCWMLKKAAEAGLLSAGLHVLDLGDIPLPAGRLGVSWYKAAGGIYIQNISEGNGKHCLRFLDREGMPISRAEERKLEQLYNRDDFARVSSDQVKATSYETGAMEQYRRYLLTGIEKGKIKERSLRVILGCPALFLQDFTSDLLAELGCSVHPFCLSSSLKKDAFEKGFSAEQVEQMKNSFKDFDADLGAIIDPWGEKLLLFTEKGNLLQGEILEALLTLVQLRHKRAGAVAVPVTASHVHEELARRYRGRVVRTKTSPRYRMEGYKNLGTVLLPPVFDGIKSIVELIDFIAAGKVTLEEILGEIPPFYLRQKEIPCSWQQKGRIMRKLMEEAPGERVEMIDGLKIHHPRGWALILPDPEKPSYRIYGEGSNEEIAESLTGFYLDRVRMLKGEEDDSK